MDTGPTLPNLTPDDRIWRIDWFGETAYRSGLRRYRQPCIKVTLSPLKCDPHDSATLQSPDCTDHYNSHNTWMPVSVLPLLAIGDLWKLGRQIASPGYQLESFKNLNIGQDSTAFIKAGLAIDEQFLLPLSHHPWHLNHTHSYCVSVMLETDKRLIIPCLELIRFYFGSSGNFLQRLFTAQLTSDSLWSKKRFNTENRHLHLVLASRISGVSAADIGRIATSKYAWRSAAGIHASCQKASIKGEPAYPYTGFPFEGHTDLFAHGIWLPFGDSDTSTFLVYRLRSCSHRFPFKSLSYEAADRKVYHDTNSDKFQEPSSRANHAKSSRTQTVNHDPGERKKPRKTRFKANVRFPDLVKKQVWREKIEAMPKTDIFLKRADGGIEQVAYGEPYGESNIASVEAIQSSAKKTTTLPKFVQDGLKAINSNSELCPNGTTVKVVYPKGKHELVFSLPILVDENGEFDDSILFIERNGLTRQRRACFTEIEHSNNDTSHMLIIEGRRHYEVPTTQHTNSAEISDILYLKL